MDFRHQRCAILCPTFSTRRGTRTVRRWRECVASIQQLRAGIAPAFPADAFFGWIVRPDRFIFNFSCPFRRDCCTAICNATCEALCDNGRRSACYVSGLRQFLQGRPLYQRIISEHAFPPNISSHRVDTSVFYCIRTLGAQPLQCQFRRIHNSLKCEGYNRLIQPLCLPAFLLCPEQGASGFSGSYGRLPQCALLSSSQHTPPALHGK